MKPFNSFPSRTVKASVCFVVLLFLLPLRVGADELRPLSINLEEYDYPYPVHFLHVVIEGQDLRMAYMDVPPVGVENGRAPNIPDTAGSIALGD
ncbi:MAG TPA: hypothetical protein VFG19_15640 [Geobacteraceae bacterium]|nr:hypothetical protein [Geobacteraceae bacterium]